MPTPRTWLPRIEEILSILKSSTVELYDRDAIEKLFQIQRRTALLLMTAVGPVKQSNGFVVPRLQLVTWVELIRDTEGQEVSRRHQALKDIDRGVEQWRSVRNQVVEADKPPVTFPITDEIINSYFSRLPAGIDIRPGEISVSFDPTSPMEACQKLYALSMALVNDFGGFLRMMQSKAVSEETAIEDLLSELEYDKAVGVRNN